MGKTEGTATTVSAELGTRQHDAEDRSAGPFSGIEIARRMWELWASDSDSAACPDSSPGGLPAQMSPGQVMPQAHPAKTQLQLEALASE